MIPLKCFTCGYFIGQHAIYYEDEKEKICNDPKLNDSDKEKKITELVLSLKLPSYCCNMRVMTSKDIVRLTLPIPTSKAQ
jgi:DNA-directed RNA polymerase subunit N (RpoN/RPB10)